MIFTSTLCNMKSRVAGASLYLRSLVTHMFLVCATFSIILWLSVFLYGMFYISYIPTLTHEMPVHLQFQMRKCKGDSLCRHPVAGVPLSKNGYEHLLAKGQRYRVFLDLEMPESEANHRVGMFMVSVNVYSRDGDIIKTSSRSGVLHYKSPMLRYIWTVLYLPMLIMGSANEKQQVTIELFNDYQEDPTRDSDIAEIELHSEDIQVYAAKLRINADFTGLRYILYHWPVTSAVVGILTNLAFLSLIVVFSWIRYLILPGNGGSGEEEELPLDDVTSGALSPRKFKLLRRKLAAADRRRQEQELKKKLKAIEGVESDVSRKSSRVPSSLSGTKHGNQRPDILASLDTVDTKEYDSAASGEATDVSDEVSDGGFLSSASASSVECTLRKRKTSKIATNPASC